MKRDPNKRDALFAILGIMIAFGVGAGYGVVSWIKSAQTRAWPSVEGTILRTDLSTGPKGVSHTYVEYTYRVGGAEWTSTRFGYGLMSTADRHRVGLLKSGNPVEVFYNPARPEQAVLLRGVNVAMIVLATVCSTVVAGLACLFAWVWKRDDLV